MTAEYVPGVYRIEIVVEAATDRDAGHLCDVARASVKLAALDQSQSRTLLAQVIDTADNSEVLA